MNIEDYYFSMRKFTLALANWQFWLKECLELDDEWVNVVTSFDLDGFTEADFLTLTVEDLKLLHEIEQQRDHARMRLKREKVKLLVWIEQAPFGKRH